MSEDRGSLGKASLELTAETTPFEKNVDKAKVSGHGLEDVLLKIVEAGDLAEHALGQVKMTEAQSAESGFSARQIIAGVRGISDESRIAAEQTDRVRLTERQAAESAAAGEEIKHDIADIGDEADRTKRKIEEVGLANKTIGGTSVSLLAAGIGAGILIAPAAGPALLGLLGAIPALALTGAGALGTLMLAFHGVGAAIGGNEKAFNRLQPAQQKFVLDVRSLTGELHHLQQVAGHQLFPLLDQGLHAALTPGTLHLITVGVAAFAHAIGVAGLQWGRFFGSTQFQQVVGPLLQAGAHWFGQFSTVALHLASAFLTLAHAAIPFVSWLGNISVKGARFVDTLLKGKDATGQLTGAFREARTSLTLLGHLVEALARFVYNLGAALYPVAKVAVKDLTDGLNWLADIIHRNQGEIRQIVGGALGALKAILIFLIPLIGRLVQGIDLVVIHMGGWKTAFAIILGGFLAAKFVALAGTILGVGKDILFVASVVAKLGPAAVIAETETAQAFAGIGTAALAAIPQIALLLSAIVAAKVAWDTFQGDATASDVFVGKNPYPKGSSDYYDYQRGLRGAGPEWIVEHPKTVSGEHLGGPVGGGNAAYQKGLAQHERVKAHRAREVAAAAHQAQQTASAIGKSLKSSDIFGSQPAWTSGTGGASGSGSGTSASALIGNSLQAAIQHAKDMAAQSQGATAVKWLATEQDLLRLAKSKLQAELKGASGKRASAIDSQIRGLDGQLTSVSVQIAAEIRKAFTQPLSTARSRIAAQMNNLKASLDRQFAEATQAYIDNVLGAQFFQGTDPKTGLQRLTPLEQQLQAMQQQDQLQSLQDAVAQASDPAAKAAAQRQLDEYNLQIAATAERAKADADYAKAVQQYQDDRAAAEKEMNTQLDALSKALQTGKGHLSDLNAIAAKFGVTLSGTGGVTGEMKKLGGAVKELATILKEEAADLRNLSLSSNPGQPPKLKHHKHPVPMAAGGIGRVSMPTLFYSAGNEDYAFSGEGRSFDRLSGKMEPIVHTHVYLDKREIARAVSEGLGSDAHSAHIAAKAIKPALARVTAIGS